MKWECLPFLNQPEGIPGGPKVWASVVHPRNKDGDPLGHVPMRLPSGWCGLRVRADGVRFEVGRGCWRHDLELLGFSWWTGLMGKYSVHDTTARRLWISGDSGAGGGAIWEMCVDHGLHGIELSHNAIRLGLHFEQIPSFSCTHVHL